MSALAFVRKLLADFGDARTTVDFDRPYTKRLLPETCRLIETDELRAIESALVAAEQDAERWRIARKLLQVVSTGPSRGYYLTSDILADEVRLSAISPDAWIDAARSATTPITTPSTVEGKDSAK